MHQDDRNAPLDHGSDVDPPGSERQRVHALNPRNRLIMPGVNRLLSVVRPTEPVLLLCGYYGEHNLGDDALLQVLSLIHI